MHVVVCDHNIQVSVFVKNLLAIGLASFLGVPWARAGKNVWYTLFAHVHNLKEITHRWHIHVG